MVIVMVCANWKHNRANNVHRSARNTTVTGLQFMLGMKWGTPFDGYRDLTSGRCRSSLDIPIKPLGAVHRRRRRARNVFVFAHLHLEQISGVVSPDISPDDYVGGRGCAAPSQEQRPKRNLFRTEIRFHHFEEFRG